MVDAEAHLARLRQAADFDTAFAAVKAFVTDAGPDRALVAAQQWCAAPEWQVQAAGLDVLAVLALDHRAAVPVLLERWGALPPRATARTCGGAPRTR